MEKKEVKKEAKPKSDKKKTKEAPVKVKKEVVLADSKKESETRGRYFEGIGKRKTSVARVRLFTKGEKDFLINKKPYQEYFTTLDLRQKAFSALDKMKCQDKFRIVVQVRGGGVNSQAEAVRHGIARALVVFNSEFRKRLRRAGLMTRDSRKRERKKFGLKRARRAPQWQKR